MIHVILREFCCFPHFSSLCFASENYDKNVCMWISNRQTFYCIVLFEFAHKKEKLHNTSVKIHKFVQCTKKLFLILFLFVVRAKV